MGMMTREKYNTKEGRDELERCLEMMRNQNR
jgi:hypothetical protein